MDETLGFESKNKSSLKSKFLVRKMSNVVTKIKCFYISRDTLAQIICSTRRSVEFLNFLLLCSTVVNRMSKSNYFEENK